MATALAPLVAPTVEATHPSRAARPGIARRRPRRLTAEPQCRTRITHHSRRTLHGTPMHGTLYCARLPAARTLLGRGVVCASLTTPPRPQYAQVPRRDVAEGPSRRGLGLGVELPAIEPDARSTSLEGQDRVTGRRLGLEEPGDERAIHVEVDSAMQCEVATCTQGTLPLLRASLGCSPSDRGATGRLVAPADIDSAHSAHAARALEGC